MTSTHAKYRHRLPQLDGRLFLTDGGLETTLIFHEGWDLTIGEAFVLCETKRGRAALRDYFDRYLPLALDHGTGFILESPTWRANPDWGAKADYPLDRLAEANRVAIGADAGHRAIHMKPPRPPSSSAVVSAPAAMAMIPAR